LTAEAPSGARSLLSPRTRIRIVWLCVVVHLVAIALMLAVLGPGLLSADPVARRAAVAGASISWGVGWCAWALATFTLILVFMAWADTLACKRWGWLAVAISLAGGLVDWSAEVVWVFLAPTWAHRAISDSFHEHLYALWDRAYQIISVGLANLLYCVAGLILTAAASQTKTFPRWLARSSATVWIASLGLSYPGFVGRTAWISPGSRCWDTAGCEPLTRSPQAKRSGAVPRFARPCARSFQSTHLR
jgi:hypothetical protein